MIHNIKPTDHGSYHVKGFQDCSIYSRNKKGLNNPVFHRMSYGLNFLAINKHRPTLDLLAKAPGYNLTYNLQPEIEGIGTNYLPAYTDLVKIR